jgi:hypothetical protein
MADTPDSDGSSADSALTFDDDPADFDPSERGSADSDRLAVAWPRSDELLRLLTNRQPPTDDERFWLKASLIMQLPTLYLYWQMNLFQRQLREGATTNRQISLYIILFPGEARDNTGVKDLNDNVIGQWWNAQYQQKRYEAIRSIFDEHTQDGFAVAAQSYKTAFVMTYAKERKDFVAKLRDLDKALQAALIDILDQAAADESTTVKQKAAIKKLRKALGKSGYRFDIFFGIRTLAPQGESILTNVYLLVTEAMKGAAIGRYAAKAPSLQTRIAWQLAAQAGIKTDPKKLDPRGKAYDWNTYMRASNLAEAIKDAVVKGKIGGTTMELNAIYVNTVWTFAYLKYKNLYWGNPEVIRDVRKRKLERAPLSEGNVTYTYFTQKDMLELWLVILNMLDFVKAFESSEFDNKLTTYHDKALLAYLQLGHDSATLDWDNLQYVLSHDAHQAAPIAVIGTACEYQFYGTVSNYRQRIFYSLDIRDMGVDLMLLYEYSNRQVGHNKYSDADLMAETFRATDPIDARRRATYDAVVAVFRKYFDQLNRNPGNAATVARQYFGGDAGSKLGSFEQSVQIMLGGDEVYIAAHPLFAAMTPAIIGELEAATFDVDRLLDLRASVAFSDALHVAVDKRREETQRSHQEAMKHADVAPGMLKELERTARRIARLIEMVEANPKKKARGQGYRDELAKLPLQALFARWKADWPPQTEQQTANLYAALQAGGVAEGEPDPVELVDFTGKVVEKKKLMQDVKALEDKVRKDVALDNARAHLAPLPPQKLMQKIIDKIAPGDDDWKKPKRWNPKPPTKSTP